MRKTTRQTATTDEQLISTKGVDEIPMKVCDTGTIKNLGAFGEPLALDLELEPLGLEI